MQQEGGKQAEFWTNTNPRRDEIMRGYHFERNSHWLLAFDPVKKQFVHLNIQHPFNPSSDGLARHLLQDIGVDADALASGRLILIETHIKNETALTDHKVLQQA